MLNLKRLGCTAAALLILCTAVLTMAQPAGAATLSQSSDISLNSSGIALENIRLESSERTVSAVHRTASATSAVIGCLENGTVLKVLSTSRNFYKIDCYDMVGYIAVSQVAQNDAGEYYVNCIPGSEETRKLPVQSNGDALSLRSAIRTTARKYIGVRYVHGGSSPKGFDCSGYTQYVFQRHNYSLWGRTVVDQLQAGVIIAKEDLQCGDLIFFKNTTGSGRFASHVGIYIGNGQMIHAGSKGITVVSLEMAYFEYHYLCSRRVILSDVAAQTVAPDLGITQNINSSYWRENTQTDDGLGSSFFREKQKILLTNGNCVL